MQLSMKSHLSFLGLCVIFGITYGGQYQGHDGGYNDNNEDNKYPYQPYGFGYDVEDGYGNKQWRHEKSHEPWHVTGSYGYKDKDGIMREVDYVADKNGFRAHIRTNEPGTAPKDPASVKMDAQPVSGGYGGEQGGYGGGQGGYGGGKGGYGGGQGGYGGGNSYSGGQGGYGGGKGGAQSYGSGKGGYGGSSQSYDSGYAATMPKYTIIPFY